MTKGNRLANKWSIYKENHPTGHVFVLILAVNLIFILGSALIISILPENAGRSVPETIRYAFTLMINPSGRYTYSDAPISTVLTTLVVLLGMISLTGGTVGFITSLISGFLEKTANDRRRLRLKDHIVILNFNQRVPSILCDYCFDDVSSTFIVIMTDEDKETVLSKIDEVYNNAGMKKRFKNVIVRNGNPMSKLDLERIALDKAKTVMIMTPEQTETTPSVTNAEQSFAVSKLFLFVSCFLSDAAEGAGPHIVVETSDDSMDAMVRDYRTQDGMGELVGVQYATVVGKILGVTTIMPTINEVLRQLFSFEGTEIYTRPIPAESVIDEIRRSRSVLPMFDLDGRRVYVAENEEEFDRASGTPYTLKKPLPKETVVPTMQFAKEEIVIIGINSKLPYILESLTCFKRQYHNQKLHVILADTADSAETLQRYYSDAAYADILMPDTYQPILISNIYRPMDELGGMINHSASTVLFLSDESVADSRVDEKPLLYWSDIQSKLKPEGSPDIVVELLAPENQSIIRRKNKDQILVSDDFLGHLYAQLGKNPLRLGVIMDMITSAGDRTSVDADNALQNAGDLVCLPVSSVFANGKYDLTFSSKRELILWVWEATGGKVLPIGCAKEGTAYLFARTDDDHDGLDSCMLLGINEGQQYEPNPAALKLEPEDELIAFIRS